MAVEPGETAVARPLTLTVATEGKNGVQKTSGVTFWSVPSVNVPKA